MPIIFNQLKKRTLLITISMLSTVIACNKENDPVSPVALAEEAYIFGLPLVTMDITRRQATNVAQAQITMQSPMNQFSHLPVFPDADFTAVVRPNADTYYSNAWFDLSQGPIILTLPGNERYHLMQIMDAYTNVFAAPGTRTTGSAGGQFLISGPDWKGSVPGEMTALKSPTNYVWILGRTEVKDPVDGATVVYPLMQQYTLTPLGAYTPPQLESHVPTGEPNSIVENMPVDEFFNYLNRLLVINPPTSADEPFMKKISKIGIGSGVEFNLSNYTAEEQNEIKKIPENVLSQLKDHQSDFPVFNGWGVMENTGNYGTDYLYRAYIARFALGANLPEDAIYPSCGADGDGNPLSGENKYMITFEEGKLPPANAFWSITMYGSNGYFVHNELNRYALGDRSNLQFNPDGSLDIYIQHENPGGEKTQNWLPAPSERFNLLLRVYSPKPEMLDGTWKTPPLKKIN